MTAKHKHKHEHIPLASLLKDSKGNEAATIRKVTIIGCCVNALLMAGKIVFGASGHSEALLADGFHSFYDFTSDIIVLAFIGIAYKKADRTYTYGYGKFETFVSLLISLILLVAGVMICYEGIESIIDYTHGETLARPELSTFIMALVAIFVKEGLFRFTSAVGKRIESSALIANAWHQRSDAFASIATLIGVTAAHFFGGKWRILDPCASILIAVIIILAAIHILMPAFRELMEKRVDDTTLEKAEAAILATKGVTGIKSIRSRRNGHFMIFDVSVYMPDSTNINEGYQVTEEIRENLVKALCPHIILSVTIVPESKAEAAMS